MPAGCLQHASQSLTHLYGTSDLDEMLGRAGPYGSGANYHASACMQAVVQLTLAVKQRPFSAVLRLSLVGLQWLLGNADAALVEFHALSVRQVQLDSLSHHVLPAITQCGSASHGRYLSAVRSLLLHVCAGSFCFLSAGFLGCNPQRVDSVARAGTGPVLDSWARVLCSGHTLLRGSSSWHVLKSV